MAKFDSKSFNPQAFGKYVERVPNTKKNELVRSKALKGNAQIRDAFSSQTTTAYARIPYFGTLEKGTQNYDGQTDITSQGSTTFERGVVVVGRADAWTENDFSWDITDGVDFMDNVAAQVAEYWTEVDQDTILAVLKGIFSMTGAANLKFVNNHTHDISGDATDNVCGETTLNTALQKAAGDNKSVFTLALMHSQVATNLENLKLLKYFTQTDAQGIERQLTLASWNGRAVLIDDSMPTENVAAKKESGTSGEPGYVPAQPAYVKYTTYVLGDGAIDFENIGAKVPYEMDRNPSKNGGQDTLYSRQRKVFAPKGISYEKKSQTTLSPTDEELSNGANWALVNDGASSDTKYFDHKAIPIARIISRG